LTETDTLMGIKQRPQQDGKSNKIIKATNNTISHSNDEIM